MFIAYFKNVSISKKLYFTIGIMAFLIVIELCVLSFAISTLSAIRGYVSGEGLWSKAQKDAILHLRLYAYSHEDVDYQNYLRHLKVPLGDRKERIALEKPVPDLQMARQGLLEGRNHPDDIDGMIKLMQRFHNNPYLARTIYYWKKAEASLLKLVPVGQQLHDAIIKGPLSPEQTMVFQKRIDEINEEVTPSEDAFSYTLGEGSRWLEHMVLRILMALALTVETTGIIIAISLSKSIQKGLGAIIDVAKRLAKGEYNQRVKVYSNDEIGILAASFNTMADHLEETIAQCRDSETKLRSFFESTRSCHVLMDKDLNIIAYNKPSSDFARDYYNIKLKQGITVDQWVHPSRLPVFIANCEKAMSGQPVVLETAITYANGKTIWWSLSFEAARNPDGEVIGISYHATDITNRVEQEQEIRSQNESLRRIAFIQSHEMRRPVASILGLINVLELDNFTATSEELMMLKLAAEELDDKIKMVVNTIDT